ncbi:MAG: hypothetical protein FJ290_18830 [Planctomycetes bacterium]|nr:hypothetical protein [Planctomycetota bacterium]
MRIGATLAGAAFLLLSTWAASQGPAPAPAAGPAGAAERILASLPHRKGFCVDLSCGGGELAQAILARSELFVHALESDGARLDKARLALEATGLYGRRVAVDRASPARLPYPDHCANLVVRGDGALVDPPVNWSEVLRILRPGGIAVLRQGPAAARQLSADEVRQHLARAGAGDAQVAESDGLWVQVRRGPLERTGDWSHGFVGTPGGNRCVEDELVKAPFQTLWINGPASFTKFGLPLLANGRVLLRHGGITHEGLWRPPAEPDLVQAFDAYNGTLLWERRLPELHGRGFVAVGDALFAQAGEHLYCLDAADGRPRWKVAAGALLEGSKHVGQYACADGVLVVALHDQPLDAQGRAGPAGALLGADPADGRRLWSFRPQTPPGHFVLGAGKAFAALPASREVLALDVRTGAEKWRIAVTDPANLKLHRGRLYAGSAAYSPDDGKLLGAARTDGILIGDRVCSGGLKGIRIADIATGKPLPGLTAARDPYCPKTGVPDGCKFMYGRCIAATASTHCYFFSYSGTVIGDLVRGRVFPTEAFRSNCRTGVIAGNGIVYNSPSGCGCALAVRGGVALVPVDEAFYDAKPETNPPPPLEKGPAYGLAEAASAATDDWPAYRHDSARSNVTAASAPRRLALAWTQRLDGELTPPAIAEGRVFVGSTNHSIYALDARTGNVAWRHRTGGEVWVTPTYWQGRLYAGSLDGWAYCLRADDGRRAWRFRGAPHERMAFCFGRPRSLWPVAGGVVVDDGVAHFYAGHCSHDRVFVHALDAATGQPRWCNDGLGRAVELTGPEGGISPHGVSPSGPLAASKDLLYVPHGMFAPAAVRKSDGKLLWWGRRGDSTQRSNIEVQNLGGPELALAEGLLFVGGADRTAGSTHPFVAVDAHTGRLHGADDPRLAEKAGRLPDGGATNVERAMFGTKPISFGQTTAPVVVDGGVFLFGYRPVFRDLRATLETQFPAAPPSTPKWPNAVPPGTLIVADDAVIAWNGHVLKMVARADGKPIARVPAEFAPRPNALAAAGGRVVLVTAHGEVACFAAPAAGGR